MKIDCTIVFDGANTPASYFRYLKANVVTAS